MATFWQNVYTPYHETVQFKILIMAFPFTEERISKLEKELENANDLLAAARQRGNKDTCTCNCINQVLTFMCTCAVCTCTYQDLNPSCLKFYCY